MDLLERLARSVGQDPDEARANSKLGKLLRRNGVRGGSEFERIKQLPRKPEDPERVELLAQLLTQAYRTPWGEMKLRPIQALALEQLHDCKGLLTPIPVGGGKTLVTLLAPKVLGAKRPVLLIPAKLRRKTLLDLAELRRHWQIQPPRLLHYEIVSHPKHATILERLQPDLILCDEVHKLKNLRVAVTKRVSRYMKDSPDTVFVALSGTITTRSLREYAHLSAWALGDTLSPVPTTWGALEEWADALDVKVPDGRRLAPGVLTELMNDAEREEARGDELKAVRKAYRRRLTESYGVVATGHVEVACSLNIDALEPNYSAETEEAFAHMARLWETPDGWPISDGATYWRHARELACGFYYVWDPRPPDEWLAARKAWCSACREILKHNRANLDTEFQVISALDQGRYKHAIASGLLAEWRAVRDSFEPNTVARWIDDGVIQVAGNWLKKTGGIAWVEHRAFGERLEDETGYPYYGPKGKSRDGRIIEKAEGPIIASVRANSEGRNLQAWNEGLIVSCTPNGAVYEQLLGRMHRTGQEADEVSFTILCGCIQAWQGFESARADARYIEASTGQNQKLNYADVTWPSATEAAQKTSARWQSAT